MKTRFPFLTKTGFQKIILFVTAIATAILIHFEAVLDRKSIKKSFKMQCESMIRFTMKILEKRNKIQCFFNERDINAYSKTDQHLRRIWVGIAIAFGIHFF